MHVAVAGAGIFGAVTARALRDRGHEVTLCDPGPLPRPEAASTDINKMVRLDYGSDAFYVALMERALAAWRGTVGFHEPGILFLTRRPLAPGGFEHESLALLARRGHRAERLDERAIGRRFPAWRGFVDGYFNPQGGWAESGRVVEDQIARAELRGVRIERAEVLGLDRGLETSRGHLAADCVVVAMGAWTPALVPEVRPLLRSVGQPVLCFRPDEPERFRPPGFVTWAAEIAETGWYGFPANDDGLVKIGHHGAGTPGAPGTVAFPADHEEACRAFLRRALPALAEAPVATRRICFYCDSSDGDFLIDRLPNRPEVVIAAGGSGHAFKFAPLLGPMVADVVEGRNDPNTSRFRWRAPKPGLEAARRA